MYYQLHLTVSYCNSPIETVYCIPVKLTENFNSQLNLLLFLPVEEIN